MSILKSIAKFAIDWLGDLFRTSNFYAEKQIWLQLNLDLTRDVYNQAPRTFVFRDEPEALKAIYVKNTRLPHEYKILGSYFKKYAEDPKACRAAYRELRAKEKVLKEERRDIKSQMRSAYAAAKALLDANI